MKRNYAQRYLDGIVVGHLLEAMRQARGLALSFDDCMAQARKQFNKEVREAALVADLPK